MDHNEKLAWASRHIEALEKSVTDFCNDNPYSVVRNLNLDTGEHEASVINVKATPPDWNLIVGDIVHAMRSSLDNLAYALAVKESGTHRADCSTALQFPIADHPYAWFDPVKKKGQRDRVALLSLPAQVEIERLQPCNRPDKTVPGVLSVLHDLSNIDKHRHLVLMLVKASDFTLHVAGQGIPAGRKVISDFRGPLEENTVVAKWSFVPNITPPDMDVKCEFSIDVEFGDAEPAPRQSVRSILPFIRDHIRGNVFPALEPFLS
jgi:hypothetical protein